MKRLLQVVWLVAGLLLVWHLSFSIADANRTAHFDCSGSADGTVTIYGNMLDRTRDHDVDLSVYLDCS